ncbi:cell wall hydrolase [Sphingomonas sp.]
MRSRSALASMLLPVAAGLLLAIPAGRAAMGLADAGDAVVPLSVDLSAPAAPPVAPTRMAATGTVRLPDLSVPAAFPHDAGIAAARPFRLRGTPIDHLRALECLTAAIYFEAANEPDDGQRAVAQVVLNRVRHPAFPATVCGTVYQGSDQSVCQFSFACDGAMARRPMASAWARARRVAADALAGRVFAPVGLATHYHTYAVTPSWNRSLVMTGVHGAHFFHRWKGAWGTPAAFRDRHMGNEPLPGPIARPIPLSTLPADTPPTGPNLPVPMAVPEAPLIAAAPQVHAAYRDSGTPVADTGSSQILDRWKDSGKPIR